MPSELERFNERMQAFFAPLWPGEEKPLVLGEVVLKNSRFAV